MQNIQTWKVGEVSAACETSAVSGPPASSKAEDLHT